MANVRLESRMVPAENSNEQNSNATSNNKSTSIDKPSSQTSLNSIDGKNTSSNENYSAGENNTGITVASSSSTATDSDLESERDNNIQVYDEQLTKKGLPRLPKRVKYFRKIFASEITDSMPNLIDYYVCAYQGDILLQGKMFVTDRYLCFYSRIINYVTKHVYRWEQIEGVTKERVAFIFPTAIGIKLKDPPRKIIYASFLSRDVAYGKILSIWSQYRNNMSPVDDDDNESVMEESPRTMGKAIERKNKTNYLSNVIDTYDPEVLEMCLPENRSKTSESIGRTKLPDEKLKSTSTYKEKALERNQKLPNRIPGNAKSTLKPDRLSRSEKKNTKSNVLPVDNSLINSASPVPSSQTDLTIDTNSRQSTSHALTAHANPSLSLNQTPSINHTNDSGHIWTLLTIMFSILNTIIQTILSAVHRFHACPSKATTFILLFLTLLFFHSFYLISLAYRVEGRLQSLHTLWPSSLIKTSISNAKH